MKQTKLKINIEMNSTAVVGIRLQSLVLDIGFFFIVCGAD